MPKIVDEQKRRDSIAEAMIALVAQKGLPAATFRAVAAERGLSLGAIQHSFSSYAELERFTLEYLMRRVGERLDKVGRTIENDLPPERILSLVEAALEELIPLDPERGKEARVWMAFTNAALNDPSLAELTGKNARAIDVFCQDCIAQLMNDQVLPATLDPALEGKRLHALLDGLTLFLLADRSSKTREDAVDILRHHLRCLAGLPD